MCRRLLTLCICVCAIALTSCSDPYAGREAVTGAITLEGQPLADGMILFDPVDGQDTASGASIENGEYKVERSAGLKPGKYRVRITSADGKTPTNDEEAGGPGGSNIVSVDRIPPEYNEQSQQQVEIKAGGPNKFDFGIPKARPIRKGKR